MLIQLLFYLWKLGRRRAIGVIALGVKPSVEPLGMTVRFWGGFLEWFVNSRSGVRLWYIVVQRGRGVRSGTGPGTRFKCGGWTSVDFHCCVGGRGCWSIFFVGCLFIKGELDDWGVQ